MIREYIKLVLESSEDQTERLKRWALAHGNETEKYLASIDVVPIPHSKKNYSKLGSGCFNTAYEVIWEGTRCVARVSLYRDELIKMKKFIDAQYDLPPKYSVHFPKVYMTIMNDERKIYGVVMELLEPLNVHLEADLDYRDYKEKISTGRGFIRNELLNKRSNLVRGFINSAVRRQAYENKKNSDRIKNELSLFYEYEILPTIKSAVDDDDDLGSVADSIKEMCRNRSDEILAEDPTLWNVYHRVYADFANEIISAFYYNLIPYDAKDMRNSAADSIVASHPSKAIKKFYEFLKVLKNNGVSYSDLHTGNFMVRPSTGDIVVVDPGLFRFGGH